MRFDTLQDHEFRRDEWNAQERKQVNAMNLSQRVTETVMNFPKVDDYAQRSALGMARTWIEKGKLDTWDPIRHKDQVQHVNRDALATAIVAVLEESEAEKDEMVAALAAARAEVNRPYQLRASASKPLPKPKDKE